MTLLLAAGIAVILAGILAIGFGIPVKEFGFGNTLILTGTIGACTGLIMISLAIVVREVKKLAPQQEEVEPAAAPRLPKRELQFPAPGEDGSGDEQSAESSGPLFSRDLPAAARGTEGGSLPPRQEEAARARGGIAAAPPPEPEEPKRRNLLFSSTRRERERAEAAAAEKQSAVESATPTPPKSFEDAWPNNERPRAEGFRRAARAPSTFTEAAPDEQLIPERYEPPSPPPKEEAAAVTVLKSGVVDGMAYSLYSDGSIEAQMPEGMMRFASIDELREHLDQRG